MNLTTEYLGLRLRSPLVASASPVSDDLELLRTLEGQGLAAVVLRSYFTDGGPTGLDEHLAHLARVRDAIGIPVLASLSGTVADDWTGPARRMEEAGADAVELNVFYIPASLDLSAAEVEESHLEIVAAVCGSVGIPVSVKMSPFYTNVGNVASRLASAGARGLVLFNRFYQPDLELETGRAFSHLLLSSEADLRPPLRWIGLLHGRVAADLGATGGIDTGQDVVKLIAVGASVTMLCSALIRRGSACLPVLEDETRTWLEVCGVESVDALRGALSPARSGDAAAFERSQFVEAVGKRLRIPPRG